MQTAEIGPVPRPPIQAAVTAMMFQKRQAINPAESPQFTKMKQKFMPTKVCTTKKFHKSAKRETEYILFHERWHEYLKFRLNPYE